MTLLTIDNLSLTFKHDGKPVEAVKRVSLSIEKGEMLALVGESGSGKSLTAMSCLGLQPASAAISGSITFDGNEMIGAPPAILKAARGKRAGVVFQEPMTALNPLHTIGRQIQEMLDIHQHLNRQDTLSRIHELLEQVGLAHFRDRLDAYPHQLSGGERQRIMIAMAIANKPALLIADEPTTAVDVTIQAKILKLIKELQTSMHMAVLFITHDLTIVRKLADRVAVMQGGEIVEQGKVSAIFDKPAHDYTRHLLASEPKGSAPPAPAGAKEIVGCEHLKVFFPIKRGVLKRTVGYVKAVNDVTISIPESSTLGVVGESGSGKTTLGFALLRMIKSEGRIVFIGEEVQNLKTSELRRLRSKMQPVFQDPFASLNPRMNIEQIIAEGLIIHNPGMSEAERVTEIDRALSDVGLPEGIKNRYPHEFSGGQRQRISIARAMVLKPKFVVLDEPTSALDLTVQTQIIDLLKKLQKEYGLSYMFISHDLRVVRAIAQHILVLRGGEVVEHAATETLFKNPKHDYTRQLIDAALLKDA